MKKLLLLLIIPLLSFGQETLVGDDFESTINLIQDAETKSSNKTAFFILLIIFFIWTALNIRFVNHLNHAGRHLISSTKTETLNAEIIKHAGSKLKSASKAYWLIMIFSIICFIVSITIFYLFT